MYLFSRGPEVTAKQNFNTKQNLILVADLALKFQKSITVHDSISAWKTWQKRQNTYHWEI